MKNYEFKGRITHLLLVIILGSVFIFNGILTPSVSNTSAAEGSGTATSSEEPAAELETVFIENHYQYAEQRPAPQKVHSRLRAIRAAQSSGPFEVGDTRTFFVSDAVRYNGNFLGIKANLISNGEHSNIWVLDDQDFHEKTDTVHTAACHLDDVSFALANTVAEEFDVIYEAMTNPITGLAGHDGILTYPGFSNLSKVGDIGEDGKVNFLLYDYKGGSSGYFWSIDFYEDANNNALDMLHINLSETYADLSGEGAGRQAFMAIMAHEFQHLLFYMHYGVYQPLTYASDSWFNEMFSAMAEAFYSQPGREVVDTGRAYSAVENDYDLTDANDVEGIYGDFLNHSGNLKGYGMERMMAHMLYKKYNGFPTKVYNYIQNTFPRVDNYDEYSDNLDKFGTMAATIGDILHAATEVGTGGMETFTQIYFDFMENMAADGGIVYHDQPVSTTKFYSSTTPAANLWAYRPVLGRPNAVVFLDDLNSRFYSLNQRNPIPTIENGKSVQFGGSGGYTADGATAEKLYRIESDLEILNVLIPAAGSSNIRFYIVIPENEVISGSVNDSPVVHTSGVNGASVYPLTRGSAREINTNGKDAYLYVVTLYGDVPSTAISIAAREHELTLSFSGSHRFPTAEYGYSEQTPLSVTAKNTGISPSGPVTVTLRGQGSRVFKIENASFTLDPGDSTVFKISPMLDLAAGNYDATVDVTSESTQSFSVSFSVRSATIRSAAITIIAPVTGEEPNTLAVSVEDTFTIGQITWAPADATFKAGVQYTATISLSALPRFDFSNTASVTINGQPAAISDNRGFIIIASLRFGQTDNPTVQGLTIRSQPDKLSYLINESLDLSGLVITVYYGDNSENNIPYSAFAGFGVKVSMAHGAVLQFYDDSRAININYKGLSVTTSKLAVSKIPRAYTKPKIDNMTYTAGLTLSKIELPAPWIWQEPTLNLTAKEHTVIILIPGDEIYADVVETVTFTVRKATPDWPEVNVPTVTESGMKLSTIPLPYGWMWKTPDAELEPGTHTYGAIFTANENYASREISITLDIPEEGTNDSYIPYILWGGIGIAAITLIALVFKRK